MIGYAYGRDLSPLQINRMIIGGPAWASTERFDLDAKAEDNSVTVDKLRKMLQSLLAERFKLQLHRETREVQAYSLVIAKGGPKFSESKDANERSATLGRVGSLSVKNATIQESLLRFLNIGNTLDGPVVDGTGLTKKYSFTLTWSPESLGANAESTLPSLPTALQEQLGLKLERTKTSVDILAIIQAEQPTPN